MMDRKTKDTPQTAAQRLKKNRIFMTRLRVVIQIVFFVLAPAMFTTAFSGIRYIFTQISNSASFSLNSFVWTLIVLCALTMVFGRFFCGYVCAFGALGDFVHWLSKWIQKKLKKKLPQIPERAAKILRFFPFVVLAFIVIACALGVYSSFSGWSPWDVFSMLTVLNFRFARYIPGLVLLILILIGMVFESRFFCRFLCPLGAVFRLLPILPWAVLRRDRENCLHGCSACQKNCPMHIELDSGENAGDCIRCGKCAAVCPKQNISPGIRKLQSRERILTIVKALVFLAAAGFLGILRFL